MRIFGFRVRNTKNKNTTPNDDTKKAIPNITQKSTIEEDVGVIVFRATGRTKRKYGI